MDKLSMELFDLVSKSKYKDKFQIDSIKNMYSVYPFNEFEYIFAHLISEGIIGINEYEKIRKEYLKRNKYLYVYEFTAPRTFGETWAQNYLNDLVPELQKPNKELDLNYSGQYDFWYEGIKIEVKASRAVEKTGIENKSLMKKALDIHSNKEFDMNFQQIKPGCCDVFVWIAVWKDEIRFWVLSSKEVANNKYYSKGQHRGNEGEGQLWVTNKNIKDFDKFLVEPNEILKAIVKSCS